MRRRSLALGSVLLSLALVVVPAAGASATLPPPVDPLPGLWSTYQKAMTGSGLADQQVAFAAWLLQQKKADRAAKDAALAGSAIPKAAPEAAKAVQITGARTISGAAAGSALTTAFAAGWMITDGTLALYANATGSEPLAGACGWGDFGVAAVQILYPFSFPECNVPVDDPNADAHGPYTVTVSGSSMVLKGRVNVTQVWGYQVAGCFLGTVPSGYTFVGKKPSDSTWYGLSSTTAYTTACANAYGGANVNYRIQEGSFTTATSVRAPDYEAYGFKNTTTLAVTEGANPISDPNRTPSCQITWPDGSVTTRTGDPYKESAGVPLGALSTLCNNGYSSKQTGETPVIPSEIKIGSTRTDTGTYSPIQTAPVPEFTPDEAKGLEGPKTGGGLVLQRVVGTAVKSCLTWEVSCANWWTATSNGTNPVVSDGYYRCLWNGGVVSLSECQPYKTTFNTQTSTPTITDPATGAESPWTSGTPDTATPTGTGTFPSTGSNPGVSVSTATGGGGCSAGWSWNPVDWVLNPLRCAFIPSTAAVNTFQTTMEGKWEATAPGGLAAAIGAWSFVAPSSSGCNGINVDMSTIAGHGVEDFQILNACAGEPLQPLAVLSTLVIGIGAVLTAIRAVTGSIGGIVGARPLAAGAAS